MGAGGSEFSNAIMTDTTTATLAPRLIVLSGLPGSGKTVLAEGLARALLIPLFSVDLIEGAMWRCGLDKANSSAVAYEAAQVLADENLRLRLSVIIDAVNPVEARRAAWRNLASKYRVGLKIIECTCADDAILRQRIESRVRAGPSHHEFTWKGLLQRRAEYESWTDPRLVLDTSRMSPAQLLTQALTYTR